MEPHIKRPTLALERIGSHERRSALLILNQPIPDFALLDRLWQNSGFRICADGGANRLYDVFSGHLEKYRNDYLPNRIHGDLDSLHPDIRHFYEQKGVPVTLDDDQYSTDFCKALKIIRHSQEHSNDNGEKYEGDSINILGSISGRLDQGLGLLHEMLREEVANPRLSLLLFSESSISFVLRPGLTSIELGISEGIVTTNIGIVPVYGPATISTQGLEWDVKEWKTQMGGNVSTSNHIVHKVVEVETDAEVLFTVERVEKLPSWLPYDTESLDN